MRLETKELVLAAIYAEYQKDLPKYGEHQPRFYRDSFTAF